MSISVFPSATLNAVNSFVMNAVAPNTVYATNFSGTPGVYTITCVSSTIARVEFYSGDTFIVAGVTSSGTVTVNLATPATRVSLFTNTGTNVNVTIQRTSNALVNAAISGTLDQITASGTYTGTSTSGFAYAVLVGGGGGGGGGGGSGSVAGSGGGGAAAVGKLVTLTGSMAVTIGQGGAGGTAGNNGPGGNGTATTFAGLTAAGGGGASFQVGGVGGVGTGGAVNTTGIAGTANTSSTASRPGGAAVNTDYIFVTSSLTGGNGGDGGGQNAPGVAGGAGRVYVLRF